MFLYRMILAILFFLVSCNQLNADVFVEGVYESVSESEWAVTVSLFSGGKAEVKLENWEAGEHDKRDIKVVNGRWSKDNNKIILNYKGIADSFEYTDNLSLSELGVEGGAPGLLQIAPISKESIVNGISLWKMPHKFTENK